MVWHNLDLDESQHLAEQSYVCKDYNLALASNYEQLQGVPPLTFLNVSTVPHQSSSDKSYFLLLRSANTNLDLAYSWWQSHKSIKAQEKPWMKVCHRITE